MNEADIHAVFTRIGVLNTEEVNGWLMGSCPLAPWQPAHPTGFDRAASFGVKIEDEEISYYSCFTCKNKGTIADLLIKLSHLQDDSELRAYAAQVQRDEIIGGKPNFGSWEGAPKVKKKSADRITEFPDPYAFERYPSVFLHGPPIKYLRQRMASFAGIVETGLRYHHRERRIVFPVYDYWTWRYAGCTGRTILTVGARKRIEDERRAAGWRNPTVPKVRDFGGLEKINLLLYRPEFGRRTPDHVFVCNGRQPPRNGTRPFIIIVEGLFAYLRLVGLGYGNVYALLGSVLTEQKAEIIKDIGKAVYWFTDNDAAGHACLYGKWNAETLRHEGHGALDMLYGELPQFVPKWPEGKDDPDQLTVDDVESMIENAEFYFKPSLTKKRRTSTLLTLSTRPHR